MIIIADRDTPPPEVPPLKTCGDFTAFVQADVMRLRHYGVSEARYYEGNMAADITIRESGALIEVFKIQPAS